MRPFNNTDTKPQIIKIHPYKVCENCFACGASCTAGALETVCMSQRERRHRVNNYRDNKAKKKSNRSAKFKGIMNRSHEHYQPAQ